MDFWFKLKDVESCSRQLSALEGIYECFLVTDGASVEGEGKNPRGRGGVYELKE